jgi:sensor histidine kinase YesM
VRERRGPRSWLQWVWTFVFNLAIAVGLTTVGWAFARRVDLLATFKWNFVIAQTIGFTVHLMFNAGLRLLGPARIENFTWLQRVLFYAGIPITGMFIGYAVALTFLGVDVPLLVVERPNMLIGIVLLSLLLSTFWYRFMANKARLAEAEAERERERSRSAELEKLALDAQLRSLQAQIEPHFLFNTLANVASLIDAAPDKARTMLERLIDLLRASLTAARSDTTTLAQESDVVAAYLDILSVRMGPRLAYEIDVDPALASVRIPPLSLQPLVENAVKHGLEPKLEGGRLVVRARRTGEGMRLDVEDDGLGFQPGAGAGVGLANLRERLGRLYDGAARLSVEELRPGTRVSITIPFGQ